MQKRVILLVATFCAVLVATLLFYQSFRAGPTYKGHSLRYWISLLAHSSEEDQLVIEAVRHLNTNTLPYLIEWIQYETPRWRFNLAFEITRRAPHDPRWPMDSIGARARDDFAAKAMSAFGWLGTNAAPAMPALVQVMNNPATPHSGRRATLALGMVGTNALPILLQVMQNPQHPRRGDAVEAISTMLHYSETPPLPASVTNLLLQIAPQVFTNSAL
jgi:hypothetical protein